jgi:hypothetical protein
MVFLLRARTLLIVGIIALFVLFYLAADVKELQHLK